jgi:hypothetical protein
MGASDRGIRHWRQHNVLPCEDGDRAYGGGLEQLIGGVKSASGEHLVWCSERLTASCKANLRSYFMSLGFA